MMWKKMLTWMAGFTFCCCVELVYKHNREKEDSHKVRRIPEDSHANRVSIVWVGLVLFNIAVRIERGKKETGD